MGNILARLGAFAGAVVLAVSAQATSAWAQNFADLPPVRATYDGNGVSVIRHKARFEGPSISIGQPGAGGLSFQYNYTEHPIYSNGSWAHPYSATAELYVHQLPAQQEIVAVIIDGRTETFDTTTSQTNVPSQQGGVVFLTLDTATSEYRYITGTGQMMAFNSAGGKLKYIQYANGERVETHYNSQGRLQSVTNNFGYQIKFEYQTNTVSATGYFTLAKATAINNAVEYCDPLADSCSGLTQTWPSLTYGLSYGGNVATHTITDSLNRTTTLVLDNFWAITSITRPGQTLTYTRSSVVGANAPVIAVTREAGAVDDVWTYGSASISENNVSKLYKIITDPEGRVEKYSAQYYTDQITDYIDPSGLKTIYTYTGELLETVKYPGDQVMTYGYGPRNNITSTTLTSASGTEAVVTTAGYEQDCTSGNILYCNKPKWTTAPHFAGTDTTNLKTDYTYDATHGGILSVTLPPVNGVRAVSYTVYALLSATYYRDHDNNPSTPAVIASIAGNIYLPVRTWACVAGSSCGVNDRSTVTIGYGLPGGGQNLQLSKVVRGDYNILGYPAQGSTVAMGYDQIGNLISVDGPLTTADGLASDDADTTRYRYDALRRVVGVIGPDPDGTSSQKARAVRKTYATTSVPEELVEEGTMTSPTGDLWTSNFTVLGKVKTHYDSRFRPDKTTLLNAAGTPQAVSEVSYNRVSQVVCRAVRMNSADFSSAPNACSQGADAKDLITQNIYDSAGRLSSVTTGVGTSSGGISTAVTEHALVYETSAGPGLGKLKSVADAKGNKTVYSYNGFGRTSQVAFPHESTVGQTGDVEVYGYNAAGQVTAFTPRGATSAITLTYDVLGRPTTAVDGTTYTYDNFGRVLTLSRSGQTSTYVYDKFGNLQSEATSLGTVAYEYDKAGRRTKMTWPGTVPLFVTYGYNAASDLLTIKENGAGTPLATFEYDERGRRTKLTRGDGTSTTYGINPDTSMLSSLTMGLPGDSDYQEATFTRDLAGRITNRASTNSAFEYAGPTTSSTITYTNNRLNQVETVTGAAHLDHDPRGNTISQGGNAYGYDIANRLETVNSGAISLAYDAAGRLRQYVGQTTTRFLYDGSDLIAEYDANGNVLRRYVHGPGANEPIVWFEGAVHSVSTSGTRARRFLAADERGSIVAVTCGETSCGTGKSLGSPLTVNTYDEYGKLTGSTDEDNYAGRFRYTGQAWLAELGSTGGTGFYYYKARLYSPTYGRFLQTDPIGYGDGLNMYAYVGNDPVNAKDPTGLYEATDSVAEVSIKGKRRVRRVAVRRCYYMFCYNLSEDQEEEEEEGDGGAQDICLISGPGRTIILPSPKDAGMAAEAAVARPRHPGAHLVAIHGDPDGVSVTGVKGEYLTADALLKLMEPNGWRPGMPIELASCNTGQGRFPQMLANRAGSIVYAPQGYCTFGSGTSRSIAAGPRQADGRRPILGDLGWNTYMPGRPVPAPIICPTGSGK